MPNLRFPEFSDEWRNYQIGDILVVGNGRDYKDLIKGPIPVFGTGGYITSVNKYLYDGETVFIGRKGTINKPWYYNGKFWTVDTLFYTFKFKNCIPYFIFNIFQNINWLQYNEASGVPSLSKSTIERIEISIPSIGEQAKISELIKLVDKRIETQSKIIDKLQSLMSGICERLLYYRTGENVKLGDILYERVEKTTENNQYEILSSTVKGIFLQRDYFSKDIASENNIGYKVVRLNDIVLSPQNLWMGNINFNDKFQIGSVSPSYKIFTITDRFYKPFIAAILKTHRALYNYELVSEQGASIVRRNLNMEAFEQLAFKIPSYDRQVQIGTTISTLRRRIDFTKNLYSALMQQKQWLLQQMFI